jgi:hypothetical protein
MDPKEPRKVPRPKLPKPRVPGRPPRVKPAGPRRKRKMMATGGVAGRLAKRGYGKAR